MKMAIIHDWLVTYAGAERVLEQMIVCFPHADLFSLIDFIPDNDRGFLQNKKAKTSVIQNFPFVKDHYRSYLPFMPLAIEQFDLSSYDVIISSSHAVAKGILTGPDQLHICMCYSPVRYAWELQNQYLKESNLESGLKGIIARSILHYIRLWDVRTANGVDKFIAISNFIARRIEKIYRRDAQVIYPPVNIDHYTLKEQKSDYYFTASRMVPYKRLPLIIETFNQLPDKKLIVAGTGPDFEKCKSMASENIEILGWCSDGDLKKYMQNAKAFIFAAEEDFGIMPLEAQASGTPVIAFGKGASLETIVNLNHEKPTGIFFSDQTPKSIIEAILTFEKNILKFDPKECRKNALRFSSESFRQNFSEYVELEIEQFRKKSDK